MDNLTVKLVLDPLSASVALSVCTANQLTGFYMRATLALNGLIRVFQILSGSRGDTPSGGLGVIENFAGGFFSWVVQRLK